ncbi:precorrin-6A reductase [Dehalobacter sp. DCM]|uniref:precorrin-6A reductase n=1 Tax=Dehalobacter sp. DCM TaxID=2907827 RepID=UPI0030815A7D|nr:precorrin-6A reductase [Dehalobacter sp. DCM]
MSKSLVIAGTAEAKEVIIQLLKMNIEVSAVVTSRLGSQALADIENIRIHQGRVSKQWIAGLLDSIEPDYVIDVSNPFSLETTRNAMSVSQIKKIGYIRYERESVIDNWKDIIRVKNHDEAYKKLLSCQGNILLTIGSGKVKVFTNIPEYKNRLFIRVLPDSKVIERCEKMGFNANNLIAMKGPFSEELNIALIKYCNAAVLVTKESGNTGGVMEKIRAAQRIGIPVIMIEREELHHENKARSVDEVIRLIQNIQQE